MHADAMDGSISVEDEDSDQRKRCLATLSLSHSSPLISNTRRSLLLHPPLHACMSEALLHILLPRYLINSLLETDNHYCCAEFQLVATV